MRLKRFVSFLMMMCCFAVFSSAAKHKYTLVIDAGHGGKDAGACAHGAKEKNINLAVALAFGRYVERNCSDVRVIYTRKTDVFIPLHERAAIANRNKADVFISIHTNSVASKKPITGMETYTMGIRRSDEKLSAAKRENEVISLEDNYQQHYAGYDPRSPESTLIFEVINETNMAQSVELAQLIQRYTCATAHRPNKGVRQDAFLVLRETSMPACLVELGYITTLSEKNYLVNSSNVDLMGRGIYQAFVAYKKAHDGKGATTTEIADPVPQVEEPQNLAVPMDPVRTEEQVRPVERTVDTNVSDIIFKVQILSSGTKLKKSDKRLKGQKNADCYREGGLWKYTIGSSTNYNEIYQLCRQLRKKFPEAFIIAFRDGKRMDTRAAIDEYKRGNSR